MDYTRWYYALVAIVMLIAAPLGFLAGFTGVSGRTALVVVLFVGALAGLGTHLWEQRLHRRGELDERHREIKLRAAYVSFAVLYGALIVLAAVVWFTEPVLPMDLVMVALVLGGVVVNLGATEWYSHRT